MLRVALKESWAKGMNDLCSLRGVAPHESPKCDVIWVAHLGTPFEAEYGNYQPQRGLIVAAARKSVELSRNLISNPEVPELERTPGSLEPGMDAWRLTLQCLVAKRSLLVLKRLADSSSMSSSCSFHVSKPPSSSMTGKSRLANRTQALAAKWHCCV